MAVVHVGGQTCRTGVDTCYQQGSALPFFIGLFATFGKGYAGRD